MQQARDLGVDNLPEPSLPTQFHVASQFYGLSGGNREYYSCGTLIHWLDECYTTVLHWHAFSRMVALKIIDVITTRLGTTPPHYPVGEFMLGVVYIDNISPSDHKRCQELFHHGVPVFDIIARTPFFDCHYPPSPPLSESETKFRCVLACKSLQNPGHRLEMVWWEHGGFPLFRPKSWEMAPLPSRVYNSLWDVIASNYPDQLASSPSAAIIDALGDIMRSQAHKLEEGFHPLTFPLYSEDKRRSQLNVATRSLVEYISVEDLTREVCSHIDGKVPLFLH